MAPELMKFFDRKNEREHELKMAQLEIDSFKAQGEIRLKERAYDMGTSEVDAISALNVEQGKMARAGGKFVAALNALVRPTVCYWYVILYSIVKFITMYMFIQQGVPWTTAVTLCWTEADMDIYVMILTFYFVGRIWDRKTNALR